jgi:hypothetical protein
MKRRRREVAVNIMTRKLSDEDSRAVDLLLDHGTGMGNDGITRVAPHVSQKRLAAAEKLLKLVGQMPTEEPPDDLVAKTMRRIDRASSRRVGHPTRRHAITQTPPLA